MVERKQYDVGIVTVELHSPSLIVTPLLTEPFELLLYSEKKVDTSAPVTPDSLDVRKNLYIPSGYSLRQWHEYWFHTAKSYLGSIRRLRQECSSARKDFGRSYR